MRHLLLAKGLWGCVNGSKVLPEDSSAQVRADFEKKEQRVFSTIALAISTPQLYLITSCEKPSETYEGNNKSSISAPILEEDRVKD